MIYSPLKSMFVWNSLTNLLESLIVQDFMQSSIYINYLIIADTIDRCIYEWINRKECFIEVTVASTLDGNKGFPNFQHNYFFTMIGG